MHSMTVLGSGSSGNCTIIQRSSGLAMFIDAGLSMRQTRQRLGRSGQSLDSVTDLLLTHLDRDHFNPAWCRTLLARGVRVHVHHRHAERAIAVGVPEQLLVVFDRDLALEDVRAEPVHMPHDAEGSIGFVLESGGRRIGFATDIGHVPDVMLNRFVDLDVLAIESNYDPELQLGSRRPPTLKERIMGGNGHLSNRQALEAVLHIAERSRLRHIVLLHLSRQCNSPAVIRSLYAEYGRDAMDMLTITSQDQPSQVLQVAPATA
ncbi:MAG: MBL fold metallo-hydrolase [Phycisphaerales bacterium]|nr:MBL fold metallo-hydrolase [Phycisphaerales bacterium]